MNLSSVHPVTELLSRIAEGDKEAANDLFNLLYTELWSIAKGIVGQPNGQSLLQPTELVHEVFVKLVQGSTLHKLKNRLAFYAVAAKSMRSILVDHARYQARQKRPPHDRRVVLDDLVETFEQSERIDLLALDEVLDELARCHPRQHEVVMLRFFAGLHFVEVAEYLEVSLSTVEKDWKFARCWLLVRLESP